MRPRTDHTLPIGEALDRSTPLARLQQLLRESEARYAVVRPLLPAALAAHVRPGPIDEQGWSLLAPNGAAAAKLRMLQPRLEQALQAQGWKPWNIRVKVVSG